MRSSPVSLKSTCGILAVLSVVACMSIIFSLITGSIPIDLSQLWQVLSSNDQTMAHRLIWELRLPRTLSAFLVGAMLSLAGALMQVALRNPLADPYILGVSGGASVAALLAILAGYSGIALSGSAFIGALFSMLLVFSLAKGAGSWSPMRVLLTGVVLAAGWGAIISFLLASSPDQNLRSMLFWLMGDLSFAQAPTWVFMITLFATGIALSQARALNLLMHGTLQAKALGASIDKIYFLIFIIASLLTAGAVSMAGSIGFIGLIVPHLIRLSIGSDHRILLPASLILGGTLLVFADTLARTLISPQQLPVGVITALLGVPLFLLILRRGVTKAL